MGKDDESNLVVAVAKIGTKLDYMQRDIDDGKERDKQTSASLATLTMGQTELKSDVSTLCSTIARVDAKADKLQADLTAHDIRDQQSVWTKSIRWLGGMNLMQVLILVGALCAAGWLLLYVLTTTLGRDHAADIIKDGMKHTKEVTIRNGEIK